MSDEQESRTVWQPVWWARLRYTLLDYSLVLTARGIDNYVDRHERGWGLYTHPADVGRAQREIEAFRRENAERPAAPRAPHQFDSGWWGVAGFIAVIWAIPVLQFAGSSIDWLDAGRMQAHRINQGEWWRTVTALTLHADIGHLASNSLFGTLFGLFVGRYLGSGYGWLLVLCAAALANRLNALIQAPTFSSIGASTATFAALGVVAAFVWRRRYFPGTLFHRGFAPIFAAVALFSFTGVGTENVDIMAHLLGLLCGALAGGLAASWDARRLGKSGQRLCALAAAIILSVSWRSALS